MAMARGGGHIRSMSNAPLMAEVAALVGDPARANILCALLGGRALTATELAFAAGVTPLTTSAHLGQLARRPASLSAEFASRRQAASRPHLLRPHRRCPRCRPGRSVDRARARHP